METATNNAKDTTMKTTYQQRPTCEATSRHFQRLVSRCKTTVTYGAIKAAKIWIEKQQFNPEVLTAELIEQYSDDDNAIVRINDRGQEYQLHFRSNGEAPAYFAAKSSSCFINC
jgi:hypothetical protein